MKLTDRQLTANELLNGILQHVMLFGGSRSGKTFVIVRRICVRAIKAPGSRHAILRFRYNAAVASILMDTLPKVMKLCFPEVVVSIDKQKGIVYFPNQSEIWIGGLDDKERTEKILGQEFATIYLNECSQIPKPSRDLAVTRLAQVCLCEIEGKEPFPLPLKMFYDCNPPGKGHWTYKVFVQGIDPDTKMPIQNHRNIFGYLQMNPQDNEDNLPASYIDTLKGLSARLQRRFLLGEFTDENPNGLFTDEQIDKWRHIEGVLPDMQRIVVAVDPSGSGDVDNADNEAIGIVVVGLGTDGNAYVMEDCTVKAGPSTWGNIATTAFERHQADIIVGEQNYGGAMVEMTIKTARPRTPYKSVTATRGKVVRAEPFSALYEQGKIRHVGYFRDLEDELTAFSTMGYMGNGSPNRADALVWALTEIFPGIVKPRKKPAQIESEHFGGWMG
jgi:phage terminase large subunit-like protein